MARAEPPLVCSAEERCNALVLHAVGEVDLATVSQLEHQVMEALQRSDRLVLDLLGVSYLDGSGLRVLDKALQFCSEQGRTLVLACSPIHQRLFEVAGLGDELHLALTIEGALSTIRRPHDADRAPPT